MLMRLTLLISVESSNPIYCLQFKVTPAASHPHFFDVSGGVASVFVRLEIQAAAEARARQYLAGQLWEAGEVLQVAELKDAPQFLYLQSDNGLWSGYQQAVQCGIGCVIASVPIGGDIADAEFPQEWLRNVE
jgi:hypothetical protein